MSQFNIFIFLAFSLISSSFYFFYSFPFFFVGLVEFLRFELRELVSYAIGSQGPLTWKVDKVHEP